jgi:hypothetical protein
VVFAGLALAGQGDRAERVALATWPETPAENPQSEQTVGSC